MRNENRTKRLLGTRHSCKVVCYKENAPNGEYFTYEYVQYICKLESSQKVVKTTKKGSYFVILCFTFL